MRSRLDRSVVGMEEAESTAGYATGETGEDERKSHLWRTTELSTLRQLCQRDCTWEEVEAALPGRSPSGIYQKALEEKLECGWMRGRLAANEALDGELRRRIEIGPQVGDIKKLAERYNLPAWYVSRRAGQLGLTTPRLKEPEWDDEEIEIVDRYGEDGAAAVHRQLRIAGFNRTPGAVCMAIKRRKIEKLSTGSMSARAVAELMGVDGKTVARWIEHCGLKARRVEGNAWGVARKELRRWLLDNPDWFDLRKVRQAWFMNLMKGE